MCEIINIHQLELDLDKSILDVDTLISRYLVCLNNIEGENIPLEIINNIKNINRYWNYLETLITDLSDRGFLDDITNILQNTLQLELKALEKIYIPLNHQIQTQIDNTPSEVWYAAESILQRMDFVLSKLSFSSEHKDRLFIQEILLENAIKHKEAFLKKYGSQLA